MIRWSNYTKITLIGLNLERYINVLRDKDIEINNIHRSNYNTISMYIRDEDIKVVKDIANNIDIEIIEYYGIKQLGRCIINRIGILIGVILSITMILILNMYTLHIKIIGLDKIQETTIIQALNDYGIYIGKINDYDSNDLHKYLLNNVSGISLVSTERKGTALIVNIKEKSATLEDMAQSFVSPYNMIINDYSIFAGIGNVVKGQMVKKGDVLIYPEEYLDSDGVLHLSKPKAYMSVTIWHTATTTLMKEETIYVRTGKVVTNYQYQIGSFSVVNHTEDNNFEYYDTEYKVQDIGEGIIPIKYTETKYYETVEETQVNDFEKVKDSLLANLTELVYNKLQGNEKIIDEFVDIVELSDRYIINKYLQCDLDLYIGE